MIQATRLALPMPTDRLAEFCKRWNVKEVALFGSVLRADFRPDSDIDVLVRLRPGARCSLMDMARMQEDLKGVFGREVDLLDREAVERSRNYIRRRAILSSAEVVYAA